MPMMQDTKTNGNGRALRGINIRTLKPTAKPPSARVLASLSPEARQRLQQVLDGPLECVYHPSFRRRQYGDTSVAAARAAIPDIPPSVDGPPPPRVLTAAEERSLFFRYNYCRNRIMRILRKHAGRRLTAAAAREALEWARRADAFRDGLVRVNLPLVMAMVKRYGKGAEETRELVSEGNLTLLRCVDKFDASRGFKFSTYACRAIRVSFHRAATRTAKRRQHFPVTFDPDLERSDHVEHVRAELEADLVAELRQIILSNDAALSPVERRILDKRYLQPGGRVGRTRGLTLHQIGDSLGLSKERVRQIQVRALGKLRTVLDERLRVAS
jgi:RNA polymerase sigma factor (sigma-70 family)